MSKWIEFVKDWANKHNMKYSNALKDPKMKEAYHSMKGGKVADPFTTAYKAGFKLGRDVIAPALMKVIPPPKKGKGIKGGATKEQRANATMLRTRIRDDDAQEELNMVAHSADTEKELAFWERKIGKKNPYKDYTNSPDIAEVGNPTPTEILDVAFEMYFDDLDRRPVEDLINNPDIFPAEGFFIPSKYISRWQNILDKVRNYAPEAGEEAMAEEAFWTHPDDPRTKNLLDLYKTYVKTKEAIYLTLMEQAYENDFKDEIRAYNKKWDARNGYSPLTSRNKGAIMFPIKVDKNNPKTWIGGRGI